MNLEIYIYVIKLIHTLSRDWSLVLTSKYSCLTCCKHLRHLQIKNPTIHHSIQQGNTSRQQLLRFSILLFTQVSESNAAISHSLSPNAVAQYIKCNIIISLNTHSFITLYQDNCGCKHTCMFRIENKKIKLKVLFCLICSPEKHTSPHNLLFFFFLSTSNIKHTHTNHVLTLSCYLSVGEH